MWTSSDSDSFLSSEYYVQMQTNILLQPLAPTKEEECQHELFLMEYLTFLKVWILKASHHFQNFVTVWKLPIVAKKAKLHNSAMNKSVEIVDDFWKEKNS